jgi:hypothetical protein
MIEQRHGDTSAASLQDIRSAGSKRELLAFARSSDISMVSRRLDPSSNLEQ